jgi:hypothetical protein
MADPKYIVLVVFDLLHLNGARLAEQDHRAYRLQQRELLGGWQGDVQARLQDPPRSHHLQGPAQPLHFGRANDCARKSCAQRETLPIAGARYMARVRGHISGQAQGQGVVVRREG